MLVHLVVSRARFKDGPFEDTDSIEATMRLPKGWERSRCLNDEGLLVNVLVSLEGGKLALFDAPGMRDKICLIKDASNHSTLQMKEIFKASAEADAKMCILAGKKARSGRAPLPVCIVKDSEIDKLSASPQRRFVKIKVCDLDPRSPSNGKFSPENPNLTGENMEVGGSFNPSVPERMIEAPQAALIDESLNLQNVGTGDRIQGTDFLSRPSQIEPYHAQGDLTDASPAGNLNNYRINVEKDDSASMTTDLKLASLPSFVPKIHDTNYLPGRDIDAVDGPPDEKNELNEKKWALISTVVKGMTSVMGTLTGANKKSRGIKDHLKDLLHSNSKWLDETESEHKSFVEAKRFLDPVQNTHKYAKKVEDVLSVLNNMEHSSMGNDCEIDPLVLVLCAVAFNHMLERGSGWTGYRVNANNMKFKKLTKVAFNCFLKLVSTVKIPSESVGLRGLGNALGSKLLCCASEDLNKCLEDIIFRFEELSVGGRCMQSSILVKLIFVRYYHCGFAFENGLAWERLKAVAPPDFCVNELQSLQFFLDKPVLLELSIFLAKSLDEVWNLCNGSLHEHRIYPLRLPGPFAGILDSLMKRSSFHKKQEEHEIFIAKFLQMMEIIDFSGSKDSGDDFEAKTRLIRTVVESLSFETTGTFGAMMRVLKIAKDNHSSYETSILGCVSSRVENDLRVCDTYKGSSGTRPKPIDVKNLLAGEYGMLLNSRSGTDAVIAYSKSILNRQRQVKAPAKVCYVNVVFKRYVSDGWAKNPRNIGKFVLRFLEKVVLTQLKEGHLHALHSIWSIAADDLDIFLPYTTTLSPIDCIIENVFRTSEVVDSVVIDYKFLFKLKEAPGENFLEHSLYARLCDGLSKGIASFFPDSTKCMDWSCIVLSDTACSNVARNIASNVLCLNLPSCMPSQFRDVLKVSERALILFFNELKLNQDTPLGSLIEKYITAIKLMVSEWSSNFESSNLSLHDFTEVLTYSDKRWSMIEQVSAITLPPIHMIDMKFKCFDKLKDSIRAAIVFQQANGEETNLRAILRGYLSDTAENDIKSLHDSFERSEYIIAHGLKNDIGTVLSLLTKDEQDLVAFRRDHDFEFQVGAYFLSSQSHLFLAALGFGEERSFPTMELLRRLKEASAKLCALFSNTATFKDLKGAAGEIKKCNGNIATEIQNIASCPCFEISEDGVRRVKLVFSLAHIGPHLRKFVDCCKQFSFTFVDGDEIFDEICHITDALNSKSMDTWTSENCAKQALLLYKLLIGSAEASAVELIDLMGLLPILKLFEKISDCSEVWTLAHDNGWFGDDGLVLFYKEYGNVTNVLLGEKSIETKILDSLAPSIRCISKLGGALNTVKLSDVINLIHSCQFVSDYHNRGLLEDFDVVQTNVSRIRSWFTDGIDDMAAILNTFAAVAASGIYQISCNDSLWICLRYQPSFGEETVDKSGQELDEFVRQLGFVQHDDQDKAGQIKCFIDEHQLVQKIFENLCAVQNLGCSFEVSYYFPHKVILGNCVAAKSKLDSSNTLVQISRETLKRIHDENLMLRLFWSKEVQRMSEVLSCNDDSTLTNVQLKTLASFCSRILIVCGSNATLSLEEINHLAKAIRLSTSINHLVKSNWILPISKFLESVQYKVIASGVAPVNVASRTKGIFMHTLTGRNDMKEEIAMRLLNDIFQGGLPECFELLDGRLPWTTYDIDIFLSRVEAFETFPNRTFAIINVQDFAGILQEKILKFLSSNGHLSGEVKLHLVQTSSTIIPPLPWLQAKSWDEATMDMNESLTLSEFHTKAGWMRGVHVVSGPVGCGKTRHIRGEMHSICSQDNAIVATIYLNEDFSLRSCIESLLRKFSVESSKRVVHFAISFAPRPEDDVFFLELMSRLHSFFISFFMVGNVHDPESGLSFDVRDCNWHVFVELQQARHTGVRSWLLKHLPVIHSVCEYVEPFQLFDIDDESRRVCTYLRALDNGTINRKFVPRRKSIIFVLDESGSMSGGRMNEATNNLLRLFDSHVQIGDLIALHCFGNDSRILVSLQQLRDDHHRAQLRQSIDMARNNRGGGTMMYTALNDAVLSMHGPLSDKMETWIICLTDGESHDNRTYCEYAVQQSSDDLHIIVIGVGLESHLHNDMRSLCNKYQQNRNSKGFFVPAGSDLNSFRGAFQTVASRIPVSQTFELDGRVTDHECRALIDKHIPAHVDQCNMLFRRFWIKFLFRRVKVLDENHDFNYNEEYDQLGSSLMITMLAEAERLLQHEHGQSWTEKNYPQLIYDFTDMKNPQFRLICTAPELMDAETRARFENLSLPGFFVPTSDELRDRETLDRYLSQALGVPLTSKEDGSEHLACIDDNGFVLTLDFTMKLLNIFERVACRVPCIMEGETGVSKTAITKMFSILRNSSLQARACEQTLGSLKCIANELEIDCAQFGTTLLVVNSVLKALDDGSTSTASTDVEIARLLEELVKRACLTREAMYECIPEEFTDDLKGNVQHAHDFFMWFSEAHLKETFFEICVDSSLTTKEISESFVPIRRTAEELSYSGALVVVFLDEVNTSSILGLFKEIIVDHSLGGEVLPENIVIAAACNPARSQSITLGGESREYDLGKDFFSGHYQVFDMPLSMSMLKWSYGSLNIEQEKEFIYRRLKMLNFDIPDNLALNLTELVSSSHCAIREFATEHLYARLTQLFPQSASLDDAAQRAKSMVSLRDIQRVFGFFEFFLSDFVPKSMDEGRNYRSAMFLTIAVVYYVRLDAVYRKKLLGVIGAIDLRTGDDSKDSLDKVFQKALDLVVEETSVPAGIALTTGLKENIFVTLVCALSRIPLMIIGPPGTSKTLSVNLVTDNAGGEQSRKPFYKKFARLQPFHYQCSKASTSKEISSVFQQAIQRQKGLNRKKDQCIVFMDEAGLPEEEKESLKVLHYYLEGHMSTKSDVSFVCITNHVLDAAKSNRCVSLLRPEPDAEELLSIVLGVLFNSRAAGRPTVHFVQYNDERMQSMQFAEQLCGAYTDFLQNDDEFKWFETFFGLRDFVHFLKAVYRASTVNESTLHTSVAIIVEALERNLNGIDREQFKALVQKFLASLNIQNDATLLRDTLHVVQEALTPSVGDFQYRPRYKLIIDESEDDSIMRLFSSKATAVGNVSRATNLFKLSGMQEDAELEKLNLVSGVKYAALQGQLAILSQTSEIHECFYDLFNLNFKMFSGRHDDDVSFYANISVGGISRPSLVDSDFQCIVHIRLSQLSNVPAPFLNRFEKFRLSIKDVLCARIGDADRVLQEIISSSLERAYDLVAFFGVKNMFGMIEGQTVESILVRMLTPRESMFKEDAAAASICCNGDPLARFAKHLCILLQEKLILQDNIETMSTYIIREALLFPSVRGTSIEQFVRDSYASDVSPQCLSGIFSRATVESTNSSLDLFVASICQMILTKSICNELLSLATPEVIFSNRQSLPTDIVQEYFHQEHFSLKRFIVRVLSEGNKKKHAYIVHMRTEPSIFTLPVRLVDAGPPSQSEAYILQNLVYERPETVALYHLAHMRNEIIIRSTINTWLDSRNKHILIIVSDMSVSSCTEKVNFVRCCAEERYERGGSEKMLFLLLHFPPSSLQSCSSLYPSLFLGIWKHHYLDNLGHDEAAVDVKRWIMAACGLVDSSLGVSSSARALLPRSLIHIAGQEVFYDHRTMSSDINIDSSINRRMGFRDRCNQLKALMNHQLVEKSSVLDVLIRKFDHLWSDETVERAFGSASKAIIDGSSNLSLSCSIHGMFQDTLDVFLSFMTRAMNEWRNLDFLVNGFACTNSLHLFEYVLRHLPLPPLEELRLQKPTPRRVRSLPTQAITFDSSSVSFPFFYFISSCIEELVEENHKCLMIDEDNSSSTEAFALLEGVMSALQGKQSHQDSRSSKELSRFKIVYYAIVFIQNLPDHERTTIFDNYLRQYLRWRVGCEIPHAMMMTWIHAQILSHNLDVADHSNIVVVHLIARCFKLDILRLASWTDPVGLSFEIMALDHEHIPNGAPQVLDIFRAIMQYFEQSFTNICDACHIRSSAFQAFLRNLSTLCSGQGIDDLSISGPLRVLCFLDILDRCSAPKQLMLKTHRHWYSIGGMNDEVRTNIQTTSLETFMQFILDESVDSEIEGSWRVDAVRSTFCLLFSPWWLAIVRSHSVADLWYLVWRNQIDEKTSRLPVVLLANSCLFDGGDSTTEFYLGLNHNVLNYLNSFLECAQFESAAGETKFLRYTPSWLTSSGGGHDTKIAVPSHDNICRFLLEDHTITLAGFLPEALFEVILVGTTSYAEQNNSQTLLMDVLDQIDQECASNDTSTSSVKEYSESSNITRGKSVQAMIVEAHLIVFVCKVAYEIAILSDFSILESEKAECILNILMEDSRRSWAHLFFSTIIRLHGQSKLFDLLHGPLNGVGWCKEWVDALPNVKAELIVSLREAESKLNESMQDEAKKAREFYRCPSCGGLFGIDQMNCGIFVCGRNTHQIQGRPGIGGNIVPEVYGCGNNFGLTEAHRYTPDEAVLQPLRTALEHIQHRIATFEERSQIWEALGTFKQPPSIFQIDRLAGTHSLLPALSVLDELDSNNFTHEDGTDDAILHALVQGRSFLRFINYLPELIEFYLWLHNVFRFLVTKEQASKMLMENILHDRFLSERFDSTHVHHILEIWGRVKQGFNLYLSSMSQRTFWECEEVPIPFEDIEQASLIMLLSAASHPTEGEECNDYLFLIINDIIQKYNAFAMKLNSLVATECEKPRELNPKFLLRGGSGDLSMLSSCEGQINEIDVSRALSMVVEGYWIPSSQTFDLAGLTKCIRTELGFPTLRPIIMSAMDYLREAFQFRTVSIEDISNTEQVQCGIGKVSSSGDVFVREHDYTLFEETVEMLKSLAFNSTQSSSDQRRSFATVFHLSSYAELRSLMEGLRTFLRLVQTSESFDTVGNSALVEDLTELFPGMEDTQQRIISNLHAPDVAELVYFLGHQLASESHLFSNHPINMCCPVDFGSYQCIHESIDGIVDESGPLSVITSIDSFVRDVLIFYDGEIRKASSDKCLVEYLEDSNFCDESDDILRILPRTLAIRNYISLRQNLHQAKLRLMLRQEGLLSGNCPSKHDKEDAHPFLRFGESWLLRDDKYDVNSAPPTSGSRMYPDIVAPSRREAFWFEEAIADGAIGLGVSEDHSAIFTNESPVIALADPKNVAHDGVALLNLEEINADDTMHGSEDDDFFSTSSSIGDFERDYAAREIQQWWRMTKEAFRDHGKLVLDGDVKVTDFEAEQCFAVNTIEYWWIFVREKKRKRLDSHDQGDDHKHIHKQKVAKRH